MIYAIDMDGVIIDSRDGVLIDAFNAYMEFFKDTKLFDNRKITLGNYRELFRRHIDIIKEFDKISPYSKSAEELVFLFYLIDKKESVSSDSDFRARLKGIKGEDLMKWHHELYRQRYIFQKQKNWQTIIKPFKEMTEFMRNNISEITILSNKDIKTIQLILGFYGVKIKKDRIFSKEITNDKNTKLGLIKKELKIDYADIHFIDDNFINLKDAKKLGVNCYFATWGFNNEQQRKEAERLGIKLLKLEDLSTISTPGTQSLQAPTNKESSRLSGQ